MAPKKKTPSYYKNRAARKAAGKSTVAHSLEKSRTMSKTMKRKQERLQKGGITPQMLEHKRLVKIREHAARQQGRHDVAANRPVPLDLSLERMKAEDMDLYVKVVHTPHLHRNAMEARDSKLRRAIFFYGLDPYNNFDPVFPYTRLRRNIIGTAALVLKMKDIPAIDYYWFLGFHEAQQEGQQVSFTHREAYIHNLSTITEYVLYSKSDLKRYRAILDQVRAQKGALSKSGDEMVVDQDGVDEDANDMAQIIGAVKQRKELPDEVDNQDIDMLEAGEEASGGETGSESDSEDEGEDESDGEGGEKLYIEDLLEEYEEQEPTAYGQGDTLLGSFVDDLQGRLKQMSLTELEDVEMSMTNKIDYDAILAAIMEQ